MKKTTVTFMVLLALLLAIPWIGYAGHGHHGGHGHGGNTRVFIGGSFWLGPPFWGPYAWGPGPYAWGPPYYYGAPAYYGPASVVVPQAPVYVQRGQDETEYWYYCDNPKGYYPYIKSCPGGWMKVVPETVPPNR